MARTPYTAERSTPLRRLPRGYYLDNFERVLESVEARYADLLRPPEQDFLDRFRTASLAARRLYVRLTSRKGPYLRRDRLRYTEIPDLDGALDELVEHGLVQHGLTDGRAEPTDDAPLVDALAVLLRPEVDQLLAEFDLDPPAKGERKAALLARLQSNVDAGALHGAMTRKVDLVRPLGEQVLLLLRLLFFGNLNQDWSEFVVRDLGVLRYETYEVRREERLFVDRRAIDHQLELRQLRYRVHQLLAASDTPNGDTSDRDTAWQLTRHVLEHAENWHPSARRVLDSLLHHIGRHLERRGQVEEALACYRQAHVPPARERQARLLAAGGDVRAAIELCGEIAEDPRDETEAAFAPAFRDRLYRRLGARFGSARKPRRRVRQLQLDAPPVGTIESAVLETLAATGQAGCFAENSLWKSLFGLAFWDIVFAPVPGAFQHPFQLGPIDLHRPEFRRQRRTAIEQRLDELRREDDLRPRLEQVREAKQGIVNAFVSWGPQLRHNLDLVLPHLRGEHLAHVCDRLSRDVRRYRCGLPDLFVLCDAQPGFVLYEVKGPNDQLRPEQGAWIDYLDGGGLPAEILSVRW